MHMFNPPHPGDVLRDYLDGVSITQAASRLQVSRSRLSRILNGHAPVTADMALRLAALLNTRAELWTGMQSEYGLWQASQKPRPVIRSLRGRIPRCDEGLDRGRAGTYGKNVSRLPLFRVRNTRYSSSGREQ